VFEFELKNAADGRVIFDDENAKWPVNGAPVLDARVR